MTSRSTSRGTWARIARVACCIHSPASGPSASAPVDMRVAALVHRPTACEGEHMATSGERAGALLSVNVGMPKDVTWHGRTVHTAVWKKPVTGPRMVRRLNIDGDGQGDLAGHGGEQRAVFVYQIESYRYWQ